MAAIVSVISRHGLSIEMCRKNQPSKNKVVLYQSLLHLSQLLFSCTKVTRWSASVIKVGMVYVGVVHVSRYLKEELTWGTDKQLRVIN